MSLRRASQPVLNPDAYLSLQEMDLDSLYQDVSKFLFQRNIGFIRRQMSYCKFLGECLINQDLTVVLFEVYELDMLILILSR